MSTYMRFRRRIRVLPGFWLNLNKRSVSASWGMRGAHVTVGTNGKRTTVGLPGSGLSVTNYTRHPDNGDSDTSQRKHPSWPAIISLAAICIMLAMLWATT